MAFESTLYRLKVAQGFLEESRQDVELGRWGYGERFGMRGFMAICEENNTSGAYS